MRSFYCTRGARYMSIAIEALLRKRTLKCNYFQWNSKRNGWFSVIGTVTHVYMLLFVILKSNKWKRASWVSATSIYLFFVVVALCELYSRQNRVIPFIQSMYLHACAREKVRCCDSYGLWFWFRILGGKWNGRTESMTFSIGSIQLMCVCVCTLYIYTAQCNWKQIAF